MARQPPRSRPRETHLLRVSSFLILVGVLVVNLPADLELRALAGTEVGVPEGETDGRAICCLVHGRRGKGEALGAGGLVEHVEVGVAD